MGRSINSKESDMASESTDMDDQLKKTSCENMKASGIETRSMERASLSSLTAPLIKDRSRTTLLKDMDSLFGNKKDTSTKEIGEMAGWRVEESLLIPLELNIKVAFLTTISIWMECLLIHLWDKKKLKRIRINALLILLKWRELIKSLLIKLAISSDLLIMI